MAPRFDLQSHSTHSDGALPAAEVVARAAEAGVELLALSDDGVPSYDHGMAHRFADVGVPCFGCTPKMLPALLEGALKGQDLFRLAEACGVKAEK